MNDRISTLLKEKHINNKNVNVMAKSILITGAGGTVGEALARFLLERYCDKTVILMIEMLRKGKFLIIYDIF